MTQPAMLVLDDEPAALDELRGTLDRRYGQECSTIRAGRAASPKAAPSSFGLLDELLLRRLERGPSPLA